MLIHFAYEKIKAHGSKCYIQVLSLVSGISGSRAQVSCLLVLYLLHNVTILQINSEVNHFNVESFLAVGYK
jgi:hypothetical protein